jgi:3-hydroxyacyl-CoA dehydrogenase
MRAAGAKSFYTDDGRVFDLLASKYVQREVDPRTASLTVLRRDNAPVLKNDGAEAWDLGDGVLGLTFKTKANSIDPDVIKMIHDSVSRAEHDFRAMVVANQGEHFCVGANLFLVVMAAGQKQWGQIRDLVGGFQGACQRMKYASVPVVAAPYGMTLGGGLEVCLGAGNVQAAAETYAGLVEVGVGLVPGGGGTMNLLWRALEGVPDGATVDTYALVTQIFKNVALARVATSAEEAKTFGYFRRDSGISFDKARLLSEAKGRAIGLATSGWHPPAPRAYVLPGESGIATLKMMVGTLVDAGQASEHDAKIAVKLAELLCGGIAGASHEVTEAEMLELEREAFVSLCGEAKSQERMQYMLMNNKPLRN